MYFLKKIVSKKKIMKNHRKNLNPILNNLKINNQIPKAFIVMFHLSKKARKFRNNLSTKSEDYLFN